MARVIESYLTVWDAGLARRFKADSRGSIVRIADFIDGPDRLSRSDNFHPGGEAYRETPGGSPRSCSARELECR